MVSIICSTCESHPDVVHLRGPLVCFPLLDPSISGFILRLYHEFWKIKTFFCFFFKNNERLFYLTELLYIQVAVQLFERFALMKALIKTGD